MSTINELDRIIDISHTILHRLDKGELLSNVLPQAQLLMNISGDSIQTALMELFIYGLDKAPSQGNSHISLEYKEAVVIYCKLCSIEDIRNLDYDQILREPFLATNHDRDHVVTISVYSMENLVKIDKPAYFSSDELANRYFQNCVYQDRAKKILSSLRSYVYTQVGDIWNKSVKEKVSITLLGPNYKLIVTNLSSLNTTVGNELLASIDNVFSDNPAKWSLSALGCRQVIIKLASLLWNSTVSTYATKEGKTLEVGKEKEKNRLLAYIDHFSRSSDIENQNILEEAARLVQPIYNESSKAKNYIRKETAQSLLVDTFHFVDLLDQATHLVVLSI
jgi:hypothetical protein